VIFLLFITLNLQNRCDIRFWVHDKAVLEDVPVYVTAFASFVAGMLCAFPLIFMVHLKKKRREKEPRAVGRKKKGEEDAS
jgi:uncharacterized integral membrane protein